MNETGKKILFIAKGLIAFAALYFLSAVLMEGVVIAFFSAQGYDVLHGDMPDNMWTELLPLYGFAGFALLTILFAKLIRKKKLADLRMELSAAKLVSLPAGLLAGALLVGIATLLLTLFGAYEFTGTAAVSFGAAFAYFLAYFIQGSAEEIMCRGFLQNYMEERTSKPAAILLSAVVFIAPHVSSIMDCSAGIALISLINLLLVSVLFSLAMMRFGSVWVSCGIHAGWNYMLSFICGLELSGSAGTGGVLHFSVNPSMDWLTGGEYGMEAGLIVSLILIACDLVLFWTARRKKEGKE